MALMEAQRDVHVSAPGSAGPAFGIGLEFDDVAGNREFFHAPPGGSGKLRDPDKCARPDMTDKEML